MPPQTAASPHSTPHRCAMRCGPHDASGSTRWSCRSMRAVEKSCPRSPASCASSRRPSPSPSTLRLVARHHLIRPITLTAHFYRESLPSPQTYLPGMRLVQAAYLFGNPGLSISDVAYRLDYSSSQSLGRNFKAMLGDT